MTITPFGHHVTNVVLTENADGTSASVTSKDTAVASNSWSIQNAVAERNASRCLLNGLSAAPCSATRGGPPAGRLPAACGTTDSSPKAWN